MTQSQPSQTNANLCNPPFSLAITALNGSDPALVGTSCLQGGDRMSQRPLSPTWAKSVNGLNYSKQYSPYFTAYRGTINLKWPGVFLFMYLFIWEEAVGMQGHYQLILLQGVFLWAEEILRFDLLWDKIWDVEVRDRRSSKAMKSTFGGKNMKKHIWDDAYLNLFQKQH